MKRSTWVASNDQIRTAVIKTATTVLQSIRLDQGFSKSGPGPGGNSIRTRLHLIFQAHLYHSDLLAVCVAHTHTHTHARTHARSYARSYAHTHTHTHTRTHTHTHTHTHTRTHAHTHRRMNQCCSNYRLFCKTKHIATSNILDKP